VNSLTPTPTHFTSSWTRRWQQITLSDNDKINTQEEFTTEHNSVNLKHVKQAATTV